MEGQYTKFIFLSSSYSLTKQASNFISFNCRGCEGPDFAFFLFLETNTTLFSTIDHIVSIDR